MRKAHDLLITFAKNKFNTSWQLAQCWPNKVVLAMSMSEEQIIGTIYVPSRLNPKPFNKYGRWE